MASEPTTNKPPSLAAQVSRAVVWNTLFVPLRLLAEVLSTLVKLNQLSQAGFGLISLVRGASNLFGTGVDLGAARALPKYIPELEGAGGRRAVLRLLAAVFALQMLVLLLVAIGLGLAHAEIGGYLQGMLGGGQVSVEAAARAELSVFVGDFGWLIILAVIVLLFLGTCYDMLMAFLSSFFRQRAWNSIALAAGVLPQLLTVAAILALPAAWDIVGVLGAMVLAPAIAVALAAWQVFGARDEQGERASFLGELGATVRDLRSALPPGFVRYSAVSYLMTVTDFVASFEFVNFFNRDIQGVALLSAGALLVRMALGYLYTPMVGVQVPLFARVRQGEGGTLNGAYQSLIRLQLLLLLPGGVGLMLLAEPALLVLNPAYLAAAPIVWVLVPCLFAECLLTTAHNALIVHERLGTIVLSRLLALAVVLPLALTLPTWAGLIGSALAFGLARLAAGAWATASGVRLLGLRWPWRFSGRVLAATAGMALLILGVRGLLPVVSSDASLGDRLLQALLMIAVAALGAAAFFAALRLLGGLDPQDRAQLERIKLPLKKWLLRLI